ncbi:MAG TPA: cytochrome c peroxidase [Oligoflexus sp.]|uniref:cytochrome-c peroxidase n=1 Tax=Oligoflexus sp. TaxID=1971216 RepID=UPI002D7FB0C4|nr:cytochrome c peroxidase [Oligoflexus sp.]HET9236533.1 cytochrome c peroxidase [Oligoflexus sp.]
MMRRLLLSILCWSLRVEGHEPIEPLPLTVELDPRLLRLGAKLFQDKRLSRHQDQSCASCHDLQRGGIEGPAAPPTRPDGFNIPTIFNVGFHFKYLWTGRAESLEEQIEITLTSPRVFQNDWPTVLQRLQGDPQYQGQSLSPDLIKKAIATYERSLITPNARFDRYLRGETQAISPLEKKGYQLFKDLGCSSCHQGRLLGGNMYQKFGIFRHANPKAERRLFERDLGRYAVTRKDEDKFVFKVPSLRNVEHTAPYFHNGSAATLDDAVAGMGRYQLGRELSRSEINSLVSFLRTLTGEWPRPVP